MTITRRGFLGSILAAAAAPAIVHAGSLMPIAAPRPIWTPWAMWQDLAMTIPVTAVGQSIAVIQNLGTINGKPFDATQPTVSERPVWSGGTWVAGGTFLLPVHPGLDGFHMDIPGGIGFNPDPETRIGETP